MPINELIEVIMKSEAGEEVLSSKFWVLSFRPARLVGLVYLVDEVHLVYLVCPVGLARAIS